MPSLSPSFLEDVREVITVLCRPLDHHERLDGEIVVRVDEPLLHDVPVTSALRLSQCWISHLTFLHKIYFVMGFLLSQNFQILDAFFTKPTSLVHHKILGQTAWGGGSSAIKKSEFDFEHIEHILCISEENGLKGLQMVQFKCPRHWNPSVSSISGDGKFSQLPKLALWGNKNGLPSMKVKKLEKCQNKRGLKGWKWSSLNAPGTQTPLCHPYWEMGNSPNSQN